MKGGAEVTNEVLGRDFFARPPDTVARELIGALLIVRGASVVRVRIVETEAYGASDDPASHAYRGRTPRNAAMFGPAGHLYVYRSYGVHWCVNVVTQPRDVASAVLVRAAELLDVVPPGAEEVPRWLRGPGNLTRALSITGDDDGRDCCAPGARVTWASSSLDSGVIGCSPRVGISRARERLSRYYLEGSAALSAPPRRARS